MKLILSFLVAAADDLMKSKPANRFRLPHPNDQDYGDDGEASYGEGSMMNCDYDLLGPTKLYYYKDDQFGNTDPSIVLFAILAVFLVYSASSIQRVLSLLAVFGVQKNKAQHSCSIGEVSYTYDSYRMEHKSFRTRVIAPSGS